MPELGEELRGARVELVERHDAGAVLVELLPSFPGRPGVTHGAAGVVELLLRAAAVAFASLSRICSKTVFNLLCMLSCVLFRFFREFSRESPSR